MSAVEGSSRVLRAVAEAWPPTGPEDARGYRHLPLADLHPLDAVALPSPDGHPSAVVVVEDPAGGLAALALVGEGQGWRVASAGDGVAEALVAALAEEGELAARFRLERASPTPRHAGERAIHVDQTNRSVVVGEAMVVKWYSHPGLGGRRAATLLAHLSDVGFRGVPRLHGTFTWDAGGGRPPVALAIVEAYLAQARDGWEWCVEAVVDHVAISHRCGQGCPAVTFPMALGRLAAGLHAALATPTARIPHPVGTSTAADVGAWREGALADLEAVMSEEAPDRHLLIERSTTLRDDLLRLEGISPTPSQPVHGDLHVGQVLQGPAGLHVIDFDGPPGRTAADLGRDPVARDVAHLAVSLELVVEVARQRLGSDIPSRALSGWGRHARGDLLKGYRMALAAAGGSVVLDERLIRPFMAHQLCRELRYAAATLPRWRHAPMGALTRLYPVGGT